MRHDRGTSDGNDIGNDVCNSHTFVVGDVLNLRLWIRVFPWSTEQQDRAEENQKSKKVGHYSWSNNFQIL